MNFDRDRAFDQTDEERDREALERLLGGTPESNHAFDGFEEGGGSPQQPEQTSNVAPPADLGASANPPNTTMPVDGPRPTATPTTGAGDQFRGQGTGWRGLDLTPVTNRTSSTPLHGFNLDRAYAGTDDNSTKDAFARWATGIQTPLAGLDHAGVANVINQNLERARQMGLNIMEVDGDRILIDTFEHGPEWFDVVENAGGENPAWAWQRQNEGGDAPVDTGQFGGADAGGRAPVSPIAPPMMPLTGGGDQQTAMDDILAEIEALMSGRGSPMDQRALEGLLR